jgi:hypothetical protein
LRPGLPGRKIGPQASEKEDGSAASLATNRAGQSRAQGASRRRGRGGPETRWKAEVLRAGAGSTPLVGAHRRRRSRRPRGDVARRPGPCSGEDVAAPGGVASERRFRCRIIGSPSIRAIPIAEQLLGACTSGSATSSSTSVSTGNDAGRFTRRDARRRTRKGRSAISASASWRTYTKRARTGRLSARPSTHREKRLGLAEPCRSLDRAVEVERGGQRGLRLRLAIGVGERLRGA